jgi:asparagine synthase (glutamine-hydrolysing)
MCGISGFIDFNNSSSKEVLKTMTDTMLHRGPDGADYQFFQTNSTQIGLGHRRLSIIDLTESGKQPMQWEHLWITFNGEIYNYQEIKKELIALNHPFISHSDTEVILHAFKQWGVQCVQKFIGMFAFVIYDSQANTITCVRDRTGIKPFFYYWYNDLFLFASELKAFHQHPHFEKKINPNAVGAFIQYGNIPAPHCIFENCYKLQPAHYLEFNLSTKQLIPKPYWNVYDYYNKPKLTISFNEAKEETEKLLHSAFNYRMIADVPVGVFLSGGYDSSCVTALLQKTANIPLKTFTIAVPDIGLNEAPYAKDIANYLGTDHNEFECTENEALNIIKKLPYYYDEPFADSSAIPTTLVSILAKKQVTVALSADGGDELFAGYNRYDYMMSYGKSLSVIPSFVRKGLAAGMNKIPATKIPYFKSAYNFANRYEKLKLLLKDPSPTNMMLSLSKQFDEAAFKRLFKNEINELHTSFLSKELHTPSFSPLAFMMAIDYQTYLPDDILQKVDRASMTGSLEGREPFLDHRVVEYVAQLPDEFKYNKGVKKYILKEITHQYIPKKLLDRPKMGFAIPIEKWLSTHLKEEVLHHLSETELNKHQLFNTSSIKKLCDDFFGGKKELAQKIWYLYMFQKWYSEWN